MYLIAKSFGFEAAHQLPDLPEGHQCARRHGHSYTVEITLAAQELQAPGFVTDFADLQPLRVYINSGFDHRDLTEVMEVASTSENLARHFFDWAQEHLELADGVSLWQVRVAETASTWACYRPQEAS